MILSGRTENLVGSQIDPCLVAVVAANPNTVEVVTKAVSIEIMAFKNNSKDSPLITKLMVKSELTEIDFEDNADVNLCSLITNPIILVLLKPSIKVLIIVVTI